MIGAVIIKDVVQNLIVIDETQIRPMQKILNCEIVDATPYGLMVGDLRTDKGWTRNADGEQMILPLLEEKSFDAYTLQQLRINSLESEIEHIADDVTNEMLAILSGEVTE